MTRCIVGKLKHYENINKRKKGEKTENWEKKKKKEKENNAKLILGDPPVVQGIPMRNLKLSKANRKGEKAQTVH